MVWMYNLSIPSALSSSTVVTGSGTALPSAEYSLLLSPAMQLQQDDPGVTVDLFVQDKCYRVCKIRHTQQQQQRRRRRRHKYEQSMPRTTPCRCLKLLLLPWIVMIGLWCFLPAFAMGDREREAYMSDRLSGGSPVTTVHNLRGLGVDDDRSDTGHGVIRWQLLERPARGNVNHKAAVLKIGHKQELDLELVMTKAQASNDAFRVDAAQPKVRIKIEWAPLLGDPFEVLGVPAGSPEHMYNMPWFQRADKVLFHHEFHGFYTDMGLCTVVPAPGVIELWKRDVVQKALRSTVPSLERGHGEKGRHDDGTEYREDVARIKELNDLSSVNEIKRETSKQLEPYRQGHGLLATFRDERSDFRSIDKISADTVRGELPSRTYPIRRALIFPLGPVPMILYVLSAFILPWLVTTFGPPLLAVYALVVAFLWIYSGRPAFVDWSAQYWLTRFWFSCWAGKSRRKASRRRRLWGPAGPVLDIEKQSATGLESKHVRVDVSLQRPMNAKLQPSPS
ncbi:hypothetical protein K504DRAFT_493690 [Pleomassaria siparia CBS 279.74]|uniref:Uncharacterized protein n=1 Tax=Pleomassaria siparia CBS 279.74 TaxID=1314801 RepID=A0A6G1JYY5_9PLEO|nr:hypothetical protein K504DRAFT_493690 [Pleomassaria siparia CBS 279.74]